MRIKNTAFIYNVTVNGSSNCDWGTDIGQGAKHTFTLEGFPEVLNAMVYYKIDDVENIKVILGKGNRTLKPFSEYNDQLVIASLFPKVYLNDTLLDDQKFIMYILKDTSPINSKGEKNVHEGRCTLKFSNSLTYNDVPVNQNCIDAITNAFGLTADGSWAILEMRIVNEDELHLYGISLSKNKKNYSSTKERDDEFDKLEFGEDIAQRLIAFKNYLYNPSTFKVATTARLYWNHVSQEKYIKRMPFVWEAIKDVCGIDTTNIASLTDPTEVHKVWEVVKKDPKNVNYSNMIGSAILSKYEDFLRSYTKQYTSPSAPPVVSLPKAIDPAKEKVYLDTQEYSYISAIRTKPFLILGGFSGTGKSQKVKELAFATCPCDGVLNVSETSPGNYLLVSVKPNWHDATDITGFRSSVNKNYYVTDFMRFLVKAKQYEDKNIPFFICLDEMNLAPVEEYFADFLSVIESRKRRKDGTIVTDALVPASVFNDDSYSNDFNIFLKLGLKPINPEWTADEINALNKEEQAQAFVRQDIVEELKLDGMTIPQNVVIIGTVNMDDTTNSFSRKVIDRAMTFETIVGEFSNDYFDSDVALSYIEKPRKGELFISDEVHAIQAIDEGRFVLTDKEKKEIIEFINNVNKDLEGSPFKVSYRILNETILLYRSKKEIERLMNEGDGFEEDVEFNADLNTIFDDILMQKILPRIEGDYEKCSKPLNELLKRCVDMDWLKSEEKIEFMIKRFGKDKSGFTSFWN